MKFKKIINTNISHNDQLKEHSISAITYAIDHFGCIPSNYGIDNVRISAVAYEALISNFENNIRRSYEDLHSNLLKRNISENKKYNDEFVLTLNVKDNFLDGYTEPDNVEDTVVLAFDSRLDTADYAKTNKEKHLACYIILYYTNHEKFVQFLEKFKEHISIHKEKEITHDSHISLVVKTSNGSLDTNTFEIKNPKINIPLSYGEEFSDIDKSIFTSLQKSDKGIWVFHGPPGTGKSMYIRHLIKKINKSEKFGEVIYMPSEMVAEIESPNFIPFIQDYQDSILVIEDADLALQSRKNHGSIVKTILQLTDGILADCLRLKIIATFNCDLSSIDEALLRKGRLQIRHEFRVLNRAEAMKLAESLKIDLELFNTPENINKNDWTLANIYNIDADFHWEKKVKKIGFGK